MFFNGWYPVIRTLVVGIMAYASLVFLLRVSGKRTLSKMKAFDLVVTVALGSTLATILLSPDVALLEGIVAFATLIGLQYLVAWLSVRSEKIASLVKSQPTLLFFRGHFLSEALRQQRVTTAEVFSAIRAQGIPSADAVLGVVLESDGSFTVIKQPQESEPNVFQDVEHFPVP